MTASRLRVRFAPRYSARIRVILPRVPQFSVATTQIPVEVYSAIRGPMGPAGNPGPQGPPGQSYNPDDLPDFTLLFENSLL